jgi:hypothetical protein
MPGKQSAPSAILVGIDVNKEPLSVGLSDGRTITVPLSWYPRLARATPVELRNWRLVGGGAGIHWPDLDEDLSTEGLLAGRPAAESQASLQRWLKERSSRPD